MKNKKANAILHFVNVNLMEFRHCVKSVQIWSIFWSVFSCIQTEYSKIRTRKYSIIGLVSKTVTSRVLNFHKF